MSNNIPGTFGLYQRATDAMKRESGIPIVNLAGNVADVMSPTIWQANHSAPRLPSLPAVRVQEPDGRGNTVNAAFARNVLAGSTRPVSAFPVDANFPAGGALRPLVLDAVAQPSLRIYQESGTQDTVVSLTRKSQYMAHMEQQDLAELQELLQRELEMFKAMSRGPYSLKLLAAMGHPYGYDGVKNHTRVVRGVARQVMGLSIGHIKGTRGSVPTMTIANEQSGDMVKAFEARLIQTSDGVILEIRNTAKAKKTGFPYPWALAASTSKMAAHGPWTYVPMRFLPLFNAAWTRATVASYHRSQAHAMVNLSYERAA